MSLIHKRAEFKASEINAVQNYEFVDCYNHTIDYVSVQMSELESDNPTNRRLSTAPHIVSMCKIVFIATNRYCVTTTEQMADEATHHEYIFRDFDKPTELKTLMDKFVQMLAPTKKYKFWIFNPVDVFDQVAPLTVLVSIWKNLQGQEPEIGGAERLESILFAVLDEFNIEVDARKTVLTATLEGSKEHLYIRPKSGDEEKITRVPSKWFFEKCSMTATRTNLEMTPERIPFFPDDLQIAEFEDCFHSAMDNQKVRESVAQMGKLMLKFSDARMAVRSRNNADIRVDIDLDVSITNYEKTDAERMNVNGHEIKVNGALCLYYCAKHWQHLRTFSANTAQIIKQNCNAVEFVTFELIMPSNGAEFNPDWGRSTSTKRGVVEVKKLPPPPANVYPDVVILSPDNKSTKETDERKTGEPSHKRSRQDHDNTYDDSDDSMA